MEYLDSIISWHEGPEHCLKVGAACCEYSLVSRDCRVVDEKVYVAQLCANLPLYHAQKVLLQAGAVLGAV